jgi:group I intron endonuclease
MTGVYMIRNLLNEKLYIGSAAKSFEWRWMLHRRTLRRGQHCNAILQRAWNKSSESAFEFRVIEECPADQCLAREQWWIDGLKPEYNICKIAGSCLGVKRSSLTRARLSAALKGKKKPPITAETRAKMSAAQKGKPHEPLTAEVRARISATKSGCKMPPITALARAHLRAAWNCPERIAKIRARMLGNKNALGHYPSPTTRIKMSKAQTGRKHTPASKAKMRAARLGFKCSDESRIKMSEAKRGKQYALGYRHTDAMKAKMSADRLGKHPSEESCFRMSNAAKLGWEKRRLRICQEKSPHL